MAAEGPESTDIRHGGGVHKMAGAKRIELAGIAILKRFWRMERPDFDVQDVHTNPAYFSKGIDLVLRDSPKNRVITADVKVDTYFGSDPTRKVRGICNPDSGVLLIETLSQLQYDRKKSDVRGWFYTSEADEIHYYYLALLNEQGELSPLLAQIRDLAAEGQSTEAAEVQLIQGLKVDQDLLITYDLREARKWFENLPEDAFRGYSGASNPTYVTVSVRVNRGLFCSRGPGRVQGPIFERVKRAL